MLPQGTPVSPGAAPTCAGTPRAARARERQRQRARARSRASAGRWSRPPDKQCLPRRARAARQLVRKAREARGGALLIQPPWRGPRLKWFLRETRTVN